MGHKMQHNTPIEDDILIIDFETAGFKPEGHKGICDIGILVVGHDLEVKAEYSSLIDPEMRISPSAAGVHGITNSMVYAEPTISEWKELMLAEGIDFERPFIFSGYNCDFDKRFWTPTFGEHFTGTLDAMGYARQYIKKDLKGDDIENWKLQTLMHALELPNLGSHRALADCQTTLGVLRHIKQLTGFSVSQLIANNESALTPTTMTFGKHRGTPLAELPSDYIRWLLDKCDSLTDERLRKRLDEIYDQRHQLQGA